MKVRKATIKDLNEIARLSLEYGKYEHKLDKNVRAPSFQEFKKLDKHFMELGTIYFLAEEGKKIMGVLSINIRKQGKEKKGVLHTILVTKEARGKGYGKALVNHALKFFKKQGCSRLDTFVHLKNKNAQSFWKKQGFELEAGYLGTKKLG